MRFRIVTPRALDSRYVACTVKERKTIHMNWEDTFVAWAKPPGQTEQTKCDNAVTAVRKAIDASSSLAKRSITVFPQGSYNNRTNVRMDSDVDICVRCTDSFFYDLPEGTAPATFGFSTPAIYPYATFKNDVDAALRSYFGKD